MEPQAEQFQIFIPSEISSDSNLNLSEMKVLSMIKALDNQFHCYATNSYFAECLNIHEKHVSRIIKSLAGKGYIEIDNGKSFRRKIKYIGKVETNQEKQTNVEKQEKVVILEDHAQKSQKTAKQDTGYISKKAKEFSSMDNHNDWDFDNIEELEMQLINKRLGAD